MHHSQILYDTAHEPKELWTIPDVGHIGALRQAAVRKRLAEYLAQEEQNGVRSSFPTAAR